LPVVLRPPLARNALELTEDGKVLLRLRRPWSDGTYAIRFEPSELLRPHVARARGARPRLKQRWRAVTRRRLAGDFTPLRLGGGRGLRRR
jgi:hypothetical protein